MSNTVECQFFTQAALERAEKNIPLEQVIGYSLDDAAFLMGLLENSQGPNTRLLAAFAKRKQKATNTLPSNNADLST